MRRISFAIGVVCSLNASVLLAQPYQLELGIGLSQIEFTIDDSFAGTESFEFDATAFGGRYYLEPVDTDSGPLAERAFLNKSAFVGFSYAETDPEFESGEGVDTTSIETRFVTEADTIIELDYGTVDGSDDSESDEYRIGAGKYLDEQTTFVVSFNREEDDDFTFDTISIGVRKVEENSEVNTAVSYEASIGILELSNNFGDDADGLQFIGSFLYYPSDQLGIGGSVLYFELEEEDTKSFGISASYFLNEEFSLQAGLEKSETSFDTETDLVLVGLTARF